MDGARAPLVSLSSTQAIVQIPWDISVGALPIAIAASGVLTNTVIPAAVEAVPDILAVVHADGSLVNGQEPARPGEIVTVYATGLGAVDTTIASGAAAPAQPLARTTGAPLVEIASQPAEILFSGLSPGFVGLYQVNILIPGDVVPSGSVTLSFGLDGSSASRAIPLGPM